MERARSGHIGGLCRDEWLKNHDDDDDDGDDDDDHDHNHDNDDDDDDGGGDDDDDHDDVICVIPGVAGSMVCGCLGRPFASRT